jgi:hypothetical protein
MASRLAIARAFLISLVIFLLFLFFFFPRILKLVTEGVFYDALSRT